MDKKIYLATLYDKDIFPTKKSHAVLKWNTRKTVKIILLNKNNEVALVTNPIHKFYLLPGGGIDNKENLWSAADRECREETGVTIKKGEIIGIIKEYRARDEKIYETFGVIAYAVQNISEDLRTKDEKNNGLFFDWHTISNANKIFQNQYKLLTLNKVEFYNTAFNIARDKLFFDTAIKHDLLI